MEIHATARKHGIEDEDIRHATEHAIVVEGLDERTRLYLGPSRSALLPEVVTVLRRRRERARDPRDEDATEVPATATRRMSMAKKTYGKTKSGEPITDELVEKLAAEADTGYDVDEMLRRRVGRPPMGSAAAGVESVRLEPELQDALLERARRDRETTSSVIRKALHEYLRLG